MGEDTESDFLYGTGSMSSPGFGRPLQRSPLGSPELPTQDFGLYPRNTSHGLARFLLSCPAPRRSLADRFLVALGGNPTLPQAGKNRVSRR